MKVKVHYFGRFVEITGKTYEIIELDDGALVRDVVEYLKKKYPLLQKEHIETSVNGKYVSENDPLGSEISVFPIISGG